MAAAAPLPQHLEALERANTIRLRRAEVKRDVIAGRKSIRDVLQVHELADVDTLEDVEPAMAGMTIGDLLCTPPRWGVARMRRLLAHVGVPESKPLGELTSRRRRSIVAAFEGQEGATRAERERIAAARARSEHEAAARDAARLERESTARRRLIEQAERERQAREAAELKAREPVDPIDVDCPNCRSQAGDVCSWYDPVRDVWTEPARPCTDRLERAGRLS